MSHGSESYFQERAHFERRLALIVGGVSLVALALHGCLLLLTTPGLLGPLTADSRLPEYFGFERGEKYVQRIFLQSSGPPGPRPGQPTIYFRSAGAVKGGRSAAATSEDAHARPDTRRIGQGPGESSEDLLARARVLYGGSSPVIQSEDLVIQDLVRPEYPENARDRNAEGLVAVVATVDVTGAVTRVDLLSSTGDRELEDAATAAVRKCRFRPYRVNDQPTEVRAVFRFQFRIYD
jgi:TonB family protein